jgi:hypothetical protein
MHIHTELLNKTMLFCQSYLFIEVCGASKFDDAISILTSDEYMLAALHLRFHLHQPFLSYALINMHISHVTASASDAARSQNGSLNRKVKNDLSLSPVRS